MLIDPVALNAMFWGLVRRSPPCWFVSHADQVNTESLAERKTDDVVLCGQAVFAALQSSGLMPARADDYYEQPQRPTQRKLLDDKKDDALRIWVARDALQRLDGHKRPLLAFDHYLLWGFQQRINTIIIGGIESKYETNLEIMVFEQRKLVAVEERIVPVTSRNAQPFASELNRIISDEKLRWKGFRVVLSAPLPMLPELADSVEYIDQAAFKHRVRETINSGSLPPLGRVLRWPAAIALTGILFYCAALGLGWQQYIAARNEYRAAAHGEPFNPELLSLLEKQRHFLDTPQPQQQLSQRARIIASALSSVDHLAVKRIFVTHQAGAGNSTLGNLTADANIAFTVDIPAANITALEQIQPILASLSKQMGADLRLDTQREKSDSSTGFKSLHLLIEGVMHD
ncbi:hypothetical protein RP726_05510 [Candidatus Methylospira mobilis]|uniref:hypothetical protein n=1 Tax=Candidatus Methylospira mobilis TaxID=1808979 RepID=UPI0028E74607|nr:hypothetical protein [Candidatus Methylospira mobilis]WNV05869.1 hypothetical protein RP726_05510 [Candidatus Methylospira mobilis]